MKKTEKLGLNVLEGADPVSVEGFNENAQILDALVSKKATMVHGAWEGDDASNKTLTFEGRPVLVIVCSKEGLFFCFQGRDLSLYHNYTSYAQSGRPIAWEDDGRTLVLKEYAHFNRSDYGTYQYIAFLEN